MFCLMGLIPCLRIQETPRGTNEATVKASQSGICPYYFPSSPLSYKKYTLGPDMNE